jgi:hypothetical protein
MFKEHESQAKGDFNGKTQDNIRNKINNDSIRLSHRVSINESVLI